MVGAASEGSERYDLRVTRAGIPELKSVQLLLAITLDRRNDMSADERTVLEEMDQQQEEWISSSGKREKEAEEEDLQGRISGTQEWKEARGEDGQRTLGE